MNILTPEMREKAAHIAGLREALEIVRANSAAADSLRPIRALENRITELEME